MKTPRYAFLKQAGRIINSGQARTILLTGNIHDLFLLSHDRGEEYLPLVPYLTAHWTLPDIILIVYELNGPIRFINQKDGHRLRDAWIRWRTGYESLDLSIIPMSAPERTAADLEYVADTYDQSLRKALNNPTLALELLRQMCVCSRTPLGGRSLLGSQLLIVVEAADMIIPEAPISSLSDADRQRVTICQDWFSDPGFAHGSDSVVLMAESRSLLHHRVARLPQILEVEIPSPDVRARKQFISWFNRERPKGKKVKLWGTQDELAKLTAGLSIHALSQLLKGAVHQDTKLSQDEVIQKVELFIQSQVGEGVVEFKKPKHTLSDVVGFRRLKDFLRRELIHRFQSSGAGALAGAAVCGPIGGGKTFIFEAFAAELDMVVLVLKNIRSQWFGQTDVLFERLRRVLRALSHVLIFIDEADTQLGGVGARSQDTERRLTGKVQSMMSDPELRGQVFWLLVTARIHLLSPDLRRPGRAGDLIIPVLDPDAADRKEFLDWTIRPVLARALTGEEHRRLQRVTEGYSAANFAALRAELRAKADLAKTALGFKEIDEIVADHLPPAITKTRRYQALQALVNCTRRSLLPHPGVGEEQRQRWAEELEQLEAEGIG